ncbi:hypothetical protein TGAM01_v202166 [Trichoderma gamsii]|uniref:Uncharacterized protein n=1 Tax=Trichoderma gamsii TaxID=398673 RepID=A0A2P4ZXP7_9HYPO|nr:hypothetical protein TGAM01_v202166 [Trichoderma gamsii]PON29058.1 hypothetical protein TGAM01_v202166 [Trichoderma gamsii]
MSQYRTILQGTMAAAEIDISQIASSLNCDYSLSFCSLTPLIHTIATWPIRLS